MSVLVQRSVLGASGYPLDQIHIRGIAARGFHGVLQSEREAGQDFSADVTLYLDTRAAARGDDLDETVNYALVAQDVHAILSGDPVNLVETVAERIADAVLTRAQVISVDVTVHKPQAPIPLPFDDVVVTIHRDRVNVPVVSASALDDAGDAQAPVADKVDSETEDEATQVEHLAPVPAVAAHPVASPPVVAPVSLPALRPIVISRPATDQMPAVPSGAPVPPPAPEPAPAPEPVPAPEPEQAPAPASGAVPVGAADASEALGVPDGTPPVPGPEETLFIPRQEPAPAPAPVRPPTPEEIAILEEQARVSAAQRRPEVFGLTRVTAGTRPDLMLDQTAVLSTTRAPEPDALDRLVPLDSSDAPADEPGPSGRPDVPEHEDTLDTTVLEPVEMLDRMDTRPSSAVDVVLALGGNLGDPQDTLRKAVADLGSVAGVEIVAVGPLARTAAVGGPDQPDFLNTVVLARTTASARELLHACQRIEHEHGRERIERWGPRTLDVDIIVYDGLIDSADDLELPHPRAHERSFVLAPWAHVDPDALLPGLGGGPVGALAATAPDRDGIRWLALDWMHEADDAPEARRATPPSIAPQVTGPLPPVHAADVDRPGPVGSAPHE